MRLYPLALKIDGWRCVVVGGGPVAERKVASLLECGACVTVVSLDFMPALLALAEDGQIDVISRPFEPDDVNGARLVIAATSQPEVNEAVATAGRLAGALVNVVDEPTSCDYYAPAIVRRGSLMIAVSTSGSFPALAKRLRQGLEEYYGPEFEAYLNLLERARELLKTHVASKDARNAAESAMMNSNALNLLREGDAHGAWRLLCACIEEQQQEKD